MKIIIGSISILMALNCRSDVTHIGKTHFVVGCERILESEQSNNPVHKMSPDSTVPFNLVTNNQIKAVYFSPGDRVHEILSYLIEQEKKHIRVAMFTFTDKAIAQKLIQAKERGVSVEIVTDSSSVYGKYNKCGVLAEGNITLYVYDPDRSSSVVPGVMHNKFFLFQDNILGRKIVWTGSFNATGAASKANRENVVVSEELVYVEKFLQEFERLKMCSHYYQKPERVIKNK